MAQVENGAAPPDSFEEDSGFTFTKEVGKMMRNNSFLSSIREEESGSDGSGKGWTMEGYLSKLSTKNKWQQRWFRLHSHYLTYYNKKPEADSATLQPAASINLWRIVDVQIKEQTRLYIELDRETAARRFKAQKHSRDTDKYYVLDAETVDAAQAWVQAMQDSIQSCFTNGSLLTLQEEYESMTGADFDKLPVNERIKKGLKHQHEQDRLSHLLLKTITVLSEPPTFHDVAGKNNSKNDKASLGTFGRDEALAVSFTFVDERQPKETVGCAKVTLPKPTSQDNEEIRQILLPVTLASGTKAQLELEWCATFAGVKRIKAFFSKPFAKASALLTLCYLCCFAVQRFILIPDVIAALFSAAVCFATGLVTPLSMAVDPKVKEDGYTHQLRHFRISPGQERALRQRVSEEKHVSTSVEDKSSENANAADKSISLEEKKLLKELRQEILSRFAQANFALPAEQNTDMYVPEVSSLVEAPLGSIEQSVEDVKQKYIRHDYRLVRFLRARSLDPVKAADMCYNALMWRIYSRAHLLPRMYVPPGWLKAYMCPPDLLELLDEGKKRQAFYYRDAKGHLCCYMRNGYTDWKRIYRKVGGDVDVLLAVGIWSLELLREDLDALHEETSGAIPSYVTLVVDLQGFAINRQIPINHALPLAKLYFKIIGNAYPELLYKVVMVNAPWLFHNMWRVFRPFLPKDLLNKVTITGHKKAAPAIQAHVNNDNIPRFLGGHAQVDDDPFCRRRVAPYGPFDPDFGQSLLRMD